MISLDQINLICREAKEDWDSIFLYWLTHNSNPAIVKNG